MAREQSVESVSRGLEALRDKARSLLIARGAMTVAGWAIGICLLAAAADFVLRTPDWLRMIMWTAGLGGLVVAVVRLVGPGLRFSPSLTEVALKVERSDAGKAAGLSGVLASGMELGRSVGRGEIGGVGAQMVEPVVIEAAARFGVVTGSLTSAAPARRAGMWLALAVVVVAAIGVLRPGLTATGASRVLMPWAGAEWPKRTEVADATRETVHPVGVALPLRAAVLRGASVNDGDRGARVWANFRVTPVGGEGAAGPVNRVLLTNQGKAVEATRREGRPAASGVLFERLVEPGALAIARPAAGATSASVRPTEGELEYWFETTDDRTDVIKIRLVEPPVVVGAGAEVIEPAYVQHGATAIAAGAKPRTIDLGPGSDERAAPPAMLAGTKVHLRVKLNKPVPGPAGSDTERAEWVRRTLGEGAAGLVESQSLRATFQGDLWELSWTLAETIRLPIRAMDQYGLSGADEAVYRFESLQDQAPTATVTRPEADESVLASAAVDVIGEGRDDVGLAAVTLEKRAARRPAGSAGAPAEAIEDWVQIGAATPGDTEEGAAGEVKQMVVQTRLDLSEQSLKAGDEVWLTALATDAFELEGARHAPTRSAVRRLTIISTEDLLAQVWNDLGSIRRDAIRLDDEQGRTAEQTAKTGESDKAQRSQASITDRIARERQGVQKVRDRIERNRLSDREMQELLKQASQQLDEAGKQSVEATQAVEEMAKAESAGQEPTPQQKADAAQEQANVRDSLEQVADLLDKGQDAWSIKRALERALEEQRQLRERTEKAGQSTTGKSPTELSPQEKNDLSQIGREQRALAERTAEAIEKMLRDQEAMKERDKTAAKAVEDAAKRGQRDRVSDRMQEAAQQVEQNQANSATSDQQRAEQSLQQMLDDINNASKSRDQELRRFLASLIEQIDVLIRDQERQLEALDKAAALPAFAGLDEPMLHLQKNTLGVMEEAGKGPREVGPVIDLLGKAADDEGGAVAALRKDKVEEEPVRAAESESLKHLKEAKETAEKLDRQAAQREADRKAAELRKAYREALTEQVSIKGETDPLVGVEATRRTRASARAVGERQQALKDRLVELRDKTKELADAVVFDYAHTRLDEAMGAAAQALSDGEATPAVQRRQQTAVRILQGLVEALDRSKKNDDEFRDNSGNNGGGSGGNGPQPLVPPIAQIKLLRSLQMEAAELTAAAEDGHDSDAVGEAGRVQSDLAGKAEALLKSLMNRRNGGGGGDGADGGRPQ